MLPVDPLPLGVRLIQITLATLVLFTLWPRIDLGVSWIFYTPGHGFPAGSQAWFEGLRNLIWRASILMVVVSLVALLAAWRQRRPVLRLTLRDWGFIAALYALAPGLLVEGLLKPGWGRARPADVTDFGGTRLFTAASDITDQCLRNCSFTAGEMSGAVALGVALALIVWRWRDRLGERALRAAAFVIAGQAILIGVQRIASGRHFLSDVLLSALLTLMVAVALLPVFRAGSEGRRC